MLKIVVPVKEEILRTAERRSLGSPEIDVANYLSELITLGFEHRLSQFYARYASGELSFEGLANELGLGIRDLYETLEERNLPTSNLNSELFSA